MYDVSDKSAAVKELQKYLRRIMYERNGLPKLAIDGVYGERTRAAVKELLSTETVDRAAWDKIYKMYHELENGKPQGIYPFPGEARNFEISQGSIGDIVIILKMMLRTLAAYYDEFGEINSDGIYDDAAEDAVRAFQRKNGLSPNGVTDIKTWNTLAREYNRAINRYEG